MGEILHLVRLRLVDSHPPGIPAAPLGEDRLVGGSGGGDSQPLRCRSEGPRDIGPKFFSDRPTRAAPSF